MGLFGPSKQFREREFSVPGMPEEFIPILASTADGQGSCPFAILSTFDGDGTPALQEGIYVESLNLKRGFTIAAGNRANTYWKVQLSMKPRVPSYGTFGASVVNDEKWFLNVLKMVHTLERAVLSVSGSKHRWP